jgi:hypothetical protein
MIWGTIIRCVNRSLLIPCLNILLDFLLWLTSWPSSLTLFLDLLPNPFFYRTFLSFSTMTRFDRPKLYQWIKVVEQRNQTKRRKELKLWWDPSDNPLRLYPGAVATKLDYLTSEEQCLALTDEQCKRIQVIVDPRANEARNSGGSIPSRSWYNCIWPGWVSRKSSPLCQSFTGRRVCSSKR